MIVNVINLPHRIDRKISVQQQAREQNFSIIFWDGIIKKNSSEGVNLAHKQIIRWAKEKCLKQVTIAEDDILFTAKGALDFYIKKFPKSYDIYFGMIYSGEINSKNRIIEGYSGNTLYTVHERFYDFFLSIPDNVNLDRELGKTALQHKYFVCNPFVCYQSGSFSDRTQRTMDYSPLLQRRKLFFKK